MTEPAKPAVPAKPKRGWFRRTLRVLGVLALLVAIFHRPLFHTGVRLLLIKVAARQNLTVDVHFSGSIFTNLTVRDVRAVPTGKAPSPVRKIEIERVRLDYSIPSLIRNGVGYFLTSYELSNAYLDLEAKPSASERERKQKKSLAEDLNNLLGQPALYADRVKIENFNIKVEAEKNLTKVDGFSMYLDPEQPGSLHIARLQIPGVPVWENLAAETSYVKRNLFLKNLRLAPELIIEEFNFDASQRSENKGSVMVKARLFGGILHSTLSGSQLNKKGENLDKGYDTRLTLEAVDISIEAAAAYFKAPKPPAAQLSRLLLTFTGEPEKPRTWTGSLAARVQGIAAGRTKLDAVELDGKFDKGRAELSSLKVAIGQNSVALSGQSLLPESINDFSTSEVDGQLAIDAPNLAELTAMLPEPLTGSANGGGPISLHQKKLGVNLDISATKIANAQLGVESAAVKIAATKLLEPKGAKPLENLTGDVSAAVTTLRFKEFTVDTVRVDAQGRNDLVTLRTLEVKRGENTVTAEGTYRIPGGEPNAAPSPIEGKFALHVPQLEAFGIAVKENLLRGRLEGAGELRYLGNSAAGSVRIEGGDFVLGGFTTRSLKAVITVAENSATIDELALNFNDHDSLGVAGKAAIQAPFPYDLALNVGIRNLAMLKPLLEVFGSKEALRGALNIEWAGKGEAAPPKSSEPPPGLIGPPRPPSALEALSHDGQLSLALNKGAFGKIDLTEIKLAAIYGPGYAESTEFRAVSGPTSLAGGLEIRDGKFKLKDIDLAQAKLTVLTGYVVVPLDLGNLSRPVPLDQRFAINVNATKLDLDKVGAGFGKPSPVSGTLTANLVAGGTPLKPFAHLKIAGRALKSKAAAQFDAAELDAAVHYSNKDLELNAVLKQPQIQPLTVKGHVPLDTEAMVRNGKLDENLPIDLTIKLPPTNLAAVPKFAPQVRRIAGTAAIDVRASGTVGKPVLSGTAAIDLKEARMASDNVPAISAFRARLAFANDTLTFNTFEGGLGGGKFRLSGGIQLPKFNEPVFDLRLVADDVLVKRDDAITIRTDADVKVTGPLKAGSAVGTVTVVESRFFKEIDILPIALPGKPKPVPKAVASDTNVSIPAIADWKLDITIKTNPNDPFLIRGNLATGAASLDLKLGGTGLAPTLVGNVRVDQLTATLPFSKLAITRGFIYFTADEPFAPSLDLQGESQLRDYLVRVYIYGRAKEPQVQLSSEPPLPHADIVSLLATGTTVSELSGSADVLASKAAVLAIQQLYRKMFKKGAPQPQEEKQRDGPGQLLDRFQFEIGSVDARSGSQAISSRFKITDQLYLLGDLNVEGQFTGGLKYLIRFR